MHVAAVHSVDGVRLLTVAESGEELTSQLARYVEEQARAMLWPADADGVRRLLAQGRAAEAVALYFERVGRRWETERLTVREVDFAFAASAASP